MCRLVVEGGVECRQWGADDKSESMYTSTIQFFVDRDEKCFVSLAEAGKSPLDIVDVLTARGSNEVATNGVEGIGAQCTNSRPQHGSHGAEEEG